MRKVISKDGTAIAYDETGKGHHNTAPKAIAPILGGILCQMKT